MTNAEREQLRELAEKATPGPWTKETLDWEDRDGELHLEYFFHDADGKRIFARAFNVPQVERLGNHECAGMLSVDAEFIAAARTAVPALLTALDSAEKRRQADFGIIFRSDGSGEPLRQSDLDRLRIAELESALSAERERVIEECLAACDGEQVDAADTGDETDIAYNNGIRDAMDAIRALRSPEVAPKETK